MHTMDKVWVAAAAGVAMASIALSVLIVRFAPENPYATQERRTAQIEAPRTARIGQSRALDAQRLYEPREKSDIARRNDNLGVNVVCAAIGVVITLSSMFAFFAWEDRRTSSAKNRHSDPPGHRQSDRELGRDPVLIAVVERRHRVRRAGQAGCNVVLERRQSCRRIVDSAPTAS